MNIQFLKDTENIFAIAAVIFILIQVVQAITTTILISVLSKIYDQISLSRKRLQWWTRAIIFSIALLLLLINSLIQVGIWATSFVMVGQFVTFRDAFYHSAVNFASLGYGDIVMDSPWRLLGALEAISGILMLGLATATLSNVFSRLMRLERSA